MKQRFRVWITDKLKGKSVPTTKKVHKHKKRKSFRNASPKSINQCFTFSRKVCAGKEVAISHYLTFKMEKEYYRYPNIRRSL